MTEFIEENFRTMADTKITIIYKENEDHITDISFTAERNYTPIFTEAFSTQELPLSVHLVGEKDILSELPNIEDVKTLLNEINFHKKS